MMHMEMGWAALCALGRQTLTLSLRCIDNRIHIFHSNAQRIAGKEADIQEQRLICRAAVLFIQGVAKTQCDIITFAYV